MEVRPRDHVGRIRRIYRRCFCVKWGDISRWKWGSDLSLPPTSLALCITRQLHKSPTTDIVPIAHHGQVVGPHSHPWFTVCRKPTNRNSSLIVPGALCNFSISVFFPSFLAFFKYQSTDPDCSMWVCIFPSLLHDRLWQVGGWWSDGDVRRPRPLWCWVAVALEPPSAKKVSC